MTRVEPAGSSRPPTILAVLPNWLGDVVMATPLLALLHQARSRDGVPVRVHAAVRRRWAPLFADDDRLAGLHVHERTGRHAGLRGAFRLAAGWRRLRPDAVVLCPPSLRMALAARLAGVPCRVGYASDGRAPLLTVAPPAPRPRGVEHHADELLGLGMHLARALALEVSPRPDALPRLPSLDAVAPLAVGEGPPVWILAPGATYGTAKAWPAPRVAEFLDLAVRDRGVRVAVVGDAGSRDLVATVRGSRPGLPWRRELPGPPAVIDLAGRTDLRALVALLRAAEAFLGNDSGVMHLAAALGVPTLGLFGSSSVAWTAPRGPRARALAAEGFPCQPCFRRTCNQRVFCLDTLAPAAVLATLLDLVAAGREAPRS
jgi:heptosyltransferase-2